MPWSAVVLVAAAAPLILSGLERGRGQFDQRFFHEPAIRKFATEWPRVDLSDYLSATTPGYHLVMAAVAKYVTGSLVGLKLVSMLFTVGLLWVLEGAVRGRLRWARASSGLEPALRTQSPPPGPLPRGGRIEALALSLPVVCSMYVLMPGVWLQPDNAAWLGVLVMLLIALRRKWDEVSLLGGALVMLLLVWTRQSHVWASGVLWVGAWVAGNVVKPESGRAAKQDWLPITRVTWGRVGRAISAVLATMPAIACLAWFTVLWGGLTPPSFQKQHAAGWNAAMPAFALSLWAVLSGFFGVWVWGGLMMLVGSWRGWAAMGTCVIAGVAVAVVPETTYLYEARATGLWNLVKLTDTMGWVVSGRTSVPMLLLAPIGAVTLAGWLMAVARSGDDGRRRAWVYGLALAGFVAAQTANTNAWQRYVEPMLLMTMALMAAEIGWPRERWLGRLAWVGLVALACLGTAITAYTLWSAEVVVKTW